MQDLMTFMMRTVNASWGLTEVIICELWPSPLIFLKEHDSFSTLRLCVLNTISDQVRGWVGQRTRNSGWSWHSNTFAIEGVLSGLLMESRRPRFRKIGIRRGRGSHLTVSDNWTDSLRNVLTSSITLPSFPSFFRLLPSFEKKSCSQK